MSPADPPYREDLAWIHHTGFAEFAESVSQGLLEILWKHGIHDGLVIDLGCGSGILSRELVQAGYDVTGVDASPAMIALARETVPEARFEVGRFGEVALPASRAIVAIGEVLNYGTFAEVSSFVANARAELLIFDIAERGSYPAYDEHRIEGDDWSVIAIKESDGTHLTRRVLTFRTHDGTMRRDEEVHTLELYDRSAIRALLREHGYRVTVRRSYGTRRLPKGHGVYVGLRRRPASAN